MIRLVAAFFLLLSAAAAHVISMSTGDAVVRNNRIEYILRMPEYELKPGLDPASALLDRLVFRRHGETARRLDGECHLDASKGQYLCAADYAFTKSDPGDINAECTFFEVTSPNHVHMLRAEREGKYDQAILDVTFSSASLTFRPPTRLEIAGQQITAGAFRTVSSAAQVLLLLALGFAIRRRRDGLLIACAFFAGECLAALLLYRMNWQPSPRFTEAAVALAVAYLALELLVWPEAGGRWLLALLFGTFSGMYFSFFLRESGYQAGYVLSGSVLAGAVLMSLCGLFQWQLRRQDWIGARWIALGGRVAAISLLVSGAIWFMIRLRS